jgi:tetratricopeptide (TPR) repeat protein
MSKVGRNDACPCGSGKKFKRCCIERFEAEERVAREQAESDRLAAEREWLEAGREFLEEGDEEELLREAETFTQVDRLAEGVLALLKLGQFDEAEATARQLLEEFPEEPLGIERLGDVYETRGDRQEAADQYRRGVAMMDALGEGHYCDCCRARLVKAVRRLDPDGPALVLGRDPQ